MQHPPFHHWVALGVRASVVCDGCGEHFEVWAHELWYQNNNKRINISNIPQRKIDQNKQGFANTLFQSEPKKEGGKTSRKSPRRRNNRLPVE